jgi:hypothetical protein
MEYNSNNLKKIIKSNKIVFNFKKIKINIKIYNLKEKKNYFLILKDL